PSIDREHYDEAKRQDWMVEMADAQHTSVAGLKYRHSGGEAAATKRGEPEKLSAEEEAKRRAEQLKQREEDQRRQQEQQRLQAQQAAEQQRAAEAAAAQQREAEAERQRQAAAAAERQRQQAAAQQTAPAQPARPAATELVTVSTPSPRYPAAAQRAGATGSMQVEFTVATDGSVTNVRAVSSDGPRQFTRDFEREAVSAVKRWRFQPVPQATTTRRTIAFQQ